MPGTGMFKTAVVAFAIFFVTIGSVDVAALAVQFLFDSILQIVLLGP